MTWRAASPPWTEDERRILRNAYRAAGGDHKRARAIIGDQLPHTRRSVTDEASRLGLSAHALAQAMKPGMVLPAPLPFGSPAPLCSCGNGRNVMFRDLDADWACIACGRIVPVAPAPERRRDRVAMAGGTSGGR